MGINASTQAPFAYLSLVHGCILTLAKYRGAIRSVSIVLSLLPAWLVSPGGILVGGILVGGIVNIGIVCVVGIHIAGIIVAWILVGWILFAGIVAIWNVAI